jgi:hypothetical protein
VVTEESRSGARRSFEAFHNGRRDDLLGALALGAPEVAGPTRRATVVVRRAFPDCRSTITTPVAEGDRVATVWPLRETHRGEEGRPAGPVAPASRPVAVTATTTLRVAGGREERAGRRAAGYARYAAVGPGPRVLPVGAATRRAVGRG